MVHVSGGFLTPVQASKVSPGGTLWCHAEVLRLLPSGATAPANAQPATAPSKAKPAPTPAVTSMTFQPPARSNGTTAAAPTVTAPSAKAAVAKATPEAAPKTAVFQPPERTVRAAVAPVGEPPKLPKAASQPEPQAKVTTTSNHVVKAGNVHWFTRLA